MTGRIIRVAVVQMAMVEDAAANLARAAELIREAAGRGAQVILLPELFEGPYFPRTMERADFERATSLADNPALAELSALCRAHRCVVPVSFFERDGDRFYNSLAVLDADGSLLGTYRKSHIPDGPGYQEKFFFRPGDTGFKVFRSAHGSLGVGICWDQWFPECARALTLAGAEMLLFPSAIGSEPTRPELDTHKPWRRAMTGHAVCNTIPLAASNRVGDEGGQRFFGGSFIVDGYGDELASLGREEVGVAVAELDLDAAAQERDWFGLIRDRRPELYGALVKDKG